MRVPFTLLLLLILQSCLAQDKKAVLEDPEISPQIYGSYDSLATAIRDKTIVPNDCKAGKVFVKFLVDINGQVKDPVIAKGLCDKANETALDIVKTIKFIPGKQKDKPIESQRVIPITFRKE